MIDPKQTRALCPLCSWPNRLTNTVCFVCGNLLDPRRQFEEAEKEERRG